MTPTPVLDRPRVATVATIDVAADGWTFAANGTRASVRLIDGAYPDFSSIVGSGDEPVHVARAIDSASSPLFFTAGDGTRHVVMPMILGATESAAWKRREDAPVAEVAAEVASVDVPDPVEVEPEPEPVTPEESAFRTQRAANARWLVKRAQRRATADVGTIAHDAPVCATCHTHASPSDNFGGECGAPFGEPAPVATIRPVATPYALAAYSEKNQARILAQCPDASDVRGFHAWLKVGRVVRKGQKGIQIIAPVMGGDDGGNVVTIKPAYVFDVTQTQARTQRAA